MVFRKSMQELWLLITGKGSRSRVCSQPREGNRRRVKIVFGQ